MRDIWEAQGVTDDHIKKATSVSALQDPALTWYIKYSNENQIVRVENIQAILKREFCRPKSKVQSIVGSKEIMMRPGKMPWELDQRLKCTICKANMNLTDGKHRE